MLLNKLKKNPKKTSDMVLIALLPGITVNTFFFGFGVIINIVIAIATALFLEIIWIAAQNDFTSSKAKDSSVILTPILLALCLPQAAPFWVPLLGTFFAIILGKQLFSENTFLKINPVMLAYTLLLVIVPETMSTMWVDPLKSQEFSKSWKAVFANEIDGITGPTALDIYKHNLGFQTAPEIMKRTLFTDSSFGFVYGTEWSGLAYLAGGLFLIYKRVIAWQIPVTFLGCLFLISAMFRMDPDATTPATIHIIAGSSIFAAFFILTDPTTSPSHLYAKLWFVTGVAAITYAIRELGPYSDSLAFSVLFMNLLASLIIKYNIKSSPDAISLSTKKYTTTLKTFFRSFVVIVPLLGLILQWAYPKISQQDENLVITELSYLIEKSAANASKDETKKIYATVIPPPSKIFAKEIISYSLDSEIVGMIIPFQTEKAYRGPIKLLVALTAEKMILGVRTVTHMETTSFVDEIISSESEWINSFNGLKYLDEEASDWFLTKDGGNFDVSTGATITQRAILKALLQTLASLNEQPSPIKQ